MEQPRMAHQHQAEANQQQDHHLDQGAFVDPRGVMNADPGTGQRTRQHVHDHRPVRQQGFQPADTHPKDQREDHRHQAHQQIDDDGVEHSEVKNAGQHRQAKFRPTQSDEPAQHPDAGPPGTSLGVLICNLHPRSATALICAHSGWPGVTPR